MSLPTPGTDQVLGRTVCAVAQLTATADVAENLRVAELLIGEAARRGAAWIGLPENFAFIGTAEGQALAHAETIADAGPIVSMLRGAAQKHRIAILGGGMPERAADHLGKRIHNTSIYVDADGDVRGVYRKIHLFDVELADGSSYHESAQVAPGDAIVSVDTGFGTMGLSVCYDVRFPELYRRLSDRGATMLTVPAAFTLHTGKDHWHALLRARAIENLAYVLAPAQVGRHNDKRVTYGHALIVDPWGTVIADAGSSNSPALVFGEIDHQRQASWRRELPSLEHRRLRETP